MDEEISIIDTKTRNEKIKSFFIKNRRSLLLSIIFIIILVISFYSYQIYIDGQKEKISNQYNDTIINYQKKTDKSKTIESLKQVINKHDRTYSPLALYFIIDNKLIEDKDEINELFEAIINETSLDKEIKNLVIYKKALFNADDINEVELINILSPLINSNSVWKSHALYLVGEFFFNNGEKQKAKDFFQKIILTENSNPDIVLSAQKRLNRDLGD